ncbi:MAG TPA: type II toxin-antitoxin system VapC family toxin [Allosphingosinicella sp.]|nr:type II toxin-antitoxin system VapC family toxin [Allosphingosinicella sp.]
MTEPRFLLDTNICIYVLADAESEAAKRVAECEEGSAIASAVTYAELLRGVRSAGPEDEAKLENFFRHVPIVPFGEAEAQAYARLPFRRGSFDRLIAAHALSLGLVLVTNNIRDFRDVPNLALENWAKP